MIFESFRIFCFTKDYFGKMGRNHRSRFIGKIRDDRNRNDTHQSVPWREETWCENCGTFGHILSNCSVNHDTGHCVVVKDIAIGAGGLGFDPRPPGPVRLRSFSRHH